VVSGFNILRFDIPLLLTKCVQYSTGKHDEVTKMWNDCFTIDHMQQLLAANTNRFVGLSLDNIVATAKSLGLNPPPHSASGSAIKELYEQKKYAEIEAHLREDLMVIRWLDLYGTKKLIEASLKKGKALFVE
jgi:hypothetical protein